MSKPGEIKYADVVRMWDRLGKVDPIQAMRQTKCRHCGASSLEGPHAADCPWAKLDAFCEAAEAEMK